MGFFFPETSRWLMIIQNGKLLIILVVVLRNFLWNLVSVMNPFLGQFYLDCTGKIYVTYGMSLLIPGDSVWSQYLGCFCQRECSENQGYRKSVWFTLTLVNLSQAAHGKCPFLKGRGDWTKCNSGPATQSSSVEEERFARTNLHFFGFVYLLQYFTKSLKLYHSENPIKISVMRREPLLSLSVSSSFMFY